MDPFLLDREPQPNGYTHFTYDIGPAERANVVVPTILAHEVLAIRAVDLLAGTMADVRPPVRRRRQGAS